MRACHYCGITAEDLAPRELRPYGPGGSDTCFPCMKASAEREAIADGAYGALRDAAAAVNGGVVFIGSSRGPQ